MKKLLMLGPAIALAAGSAQAETINILMESVPDTRFVQDVVPQFTEQTGIEVDIEVVNYAEMHTKLVPQLVAPTGSYDVIDDPQEQAAFKEKYGIDLRVPETWDEYMKQVEFFTRDTDGNGQIDFYGVVNQGLRPDPIAMEWSNYLYANGGQYYDESWRPMLDTPEAIEALEDYKNNLNQYGPVGAASFGFDEAFNVAAQGKAYSYITYNMFRTAYDDPEQSAVVGRVEIAPVPSGGLNGAWGWAIPNSSPNPEAAWTFLKWIESPEIAKERALLGGSPTRSDVFDDPELAEKYPYYPALRDLLDTARNFPVFTYTPQFVEVLGRELSLAVTGEKDSEEALQTVNEEFGEMLERDGKL